MSDTYHIACRDCKQSLWVMQSRYKRKRCEEGIQVTTEEIEAKLAELETVLQMTMTAVRNLTAIVSGNQQAMTDLLNQMTKAMESK